MKRGSRRAEVRSRNADVEAPDAPDDRGDDRGPARQPTTEEGSDNSVTAPAEADPEPERDHRRDHAGDEVSGGAHQARLPETDVADIWDTAVPDAGERADPAERRRVPSVDDTTATVDRAHLASMEIANRERLDELAEREEPDDDALLDELARWSTDDQHTDHRHAGTARDATGNTDDLEAPDVLVR